MASFLPVDVSLMCFDVAKLADFVTGFRVEGEMVFSNVVVDFIGEGLPALAMESLA